MDLKGAGNFLFNFLHNYISCHALVFSEQTHPHTDTYEKYYEKRNACLSSDVLT